MASRQVVGKSLRMSNTCASAYPGTTIRADAIVSKGFSAVRLPSFLSTSTCRDCNDRSCKPCFSSVRRMTLASAGGITVAAAFSCHAFHCLEIAARNSSFSRPFTPCRWFSLDRAAFARNASCNNSKHVDACPFQPRFHYLLLFAGVGSGKRSFLRGCSEIRRRRD